MNEVAKRMMAAIEASEKAASRLTSVGMTVVVQRDDRTLFTSKTLSMPWTLGHGAWVVKVEGISGGYDCARVTPAPEKCTGVPI